MLQFRLQITVQSIMVTLLVTGRSTATKPFKCPLEAFCAAQSANVLCYAEAGDRDCINGNNHQWHDSVATNITIGNGVSCTVKFDCLQRYTYKKVYVVRQDEANGAPYSLGNVKALKGFVASTLVLRNLGLYKVTADVFYHFSTALVELDLSFNEIDDMLDKFAFRQTGLNILYLAYNELKFVPESSLKYLRLLSKLYLSGNHISKICKTNFRTLTQLTFLDLGENQIEHIESHSFFSLGLLKTLKLDSNKLATLSETVFEGMKNLYELNLGRNQLREVPVKSFKYVSQLEKLHLSGNKIGGLTKISFAHLKKITFLEISFNALTALDPETIHVIPTLQELYIQGNQFECDCKLVWLRCFQLCLCILNIDNCSFPLEFKAYTTIDFPPNDKCDGQTPMMECSPNISCNYYDPKTTQLPTYTESEQAILGSNPNENGFFMDTVLGAVGEPQGYTTMKPTESLLALSKEEHTLQGHEKSNTYKSSKSGAKDGTSNQVLDSMEPNSPSKPDDDVKHLNDAHTTGPCIEEPLFITDRELDFVQDYENLSICLDLTKFAVTRNKPSRTHLLKPLASSIAAVFFILILVFFTVRHCRKWFARKYGTNETYIEASQAMYSTSSALDTAEV